MSEQVLTANVCVVGGAGAGLLAAIRAKEEGAQSVVLLEKMKLLGGCTRLAGCMFAVDSPVHKRLGVDIDLDALYQQHMRQSLWRCDAMLVRKWYKQIGETCQWLEKHGIPFEEEATAFSGTTRVLINYQGRGNALINKLTAIAEENGIQIILETSAKHLITDDNGAVIGVLAERNGNSMKVNAESVVIATGSLTNNKDLLDRMYPGEDYHKLKRMAGVSHNNGDGLIMCEEIGAKAGPMHTLYIGPHNHPSNMRVGNIMRRYMMVHLNRNGERFTNEALPESEDWGWMRAVAQDRQPDHKCFPIMDESIFRRMLKEHKNYSDIEAGQGSMKSQDLLSKYGQDNIAEMVDDRTAWLDMLEDDFKVEAERGKIKICQTLDAAAEWIGAEPNILKDTIEKYNSFCRDGYDADFLKDPQYLWPLTKPPYYVFEGLQGIDTCVGGITIDHNMRVLNKDSYPIKNLYAAGVCTSGWANNGYGFFGTCLSLTSFSGWYAGKAAAENIKGTS